MAEKKVQIGFRTTEAFQRRIESECIKRELSLQDLVRYALEWYFKTPPPDDWDYADIIYHQDPESTDKERVEREKWGVLWVKYVNEMPREKILLMADVMKLDLLHYKSSRRKGGWKRRDSGSKR